MEYKKIITIDSLFRENRDTSKSGDFRVHLRDNIINVISMKLHDIVLPYSWYRISKEQGNNTLIINNGPTDTTYILPDGNYDSFSDITSALISGPFPYTLTQEPHTKKVCIKNNPLPGTKFIVKLSAHVGDDDTRGLAWLLGFRKKTECKTEHTGEGILLIGEDMRCRYFYLVVDDDKSIDNFNAESMNRKKFVNGFILARLIIQIQDNTLSHVRFEKHTRIYDGPCDINKLDIKLIDEWGYIVNLNDMELSLSLELTIKL